MLSFASDSSQEGKKIPKLEELEDSDQEEVADVEIEVAGSNELALPWIRSL